MDHKNEIILDANTANSWCEDGDHFVRRRQKSWERSNSEGKIFNP